MLCMLCCCACSFTIYYKPSTPNPKYVVMHIRHAALSGQHCPAFEGHIVNQGASVHNASQHAEFRTRSSTVCRLVMSLPAFRCRPRPATAGRAVGSSFEGCHRGRRLQPCPLGPACPVLQVAQHVARTAASKHLCMALTCLAALLVSTCRVSVSVSAGTICQACLGTHGFQKQVLADSTSEASAGLLALLPVSKPGADKKVRLLV